MRVGLSILLTIILGTLNGCINSNTESSQKTTIQVPCEISNGNGVIGCGKVPISLKDDVNKKLSPNCNINFENFSEKSKKCLEENYNRPADTYILGNLKYFGQYFTQDQEEGLKLIKIAAEHSNPEANAWLGEYYAKKGDIPQSVKYTAVAAELGSPLAMHRLAGRYIRGQGVEKDTEKALLLLNQTKKYIPASYSEIALIDLQKSDVEGFIRNNNIAIEKKYWFSLVDLAALYLGELPNFENYRDLNKANQLANELINHEVPSGGFIKARVLKYQTVKNPEICKLLNRSFEKGYLEAGINLGTEYVEGNNCEKNYKQALKIFQILLNVDDDEIKVAAATNLGFLYLNGLGVLQDKAKSKEYLQYAANKGYKPAQDMLNNLN